MAGDLSFGAWLKQQRRARDLTQAELAQQVGCAVETIKRIEGNTRRPGKQMVARLLDCLAIPAAERPAISRFARTGQPDQGQRPGRAGPSPAARPEQASQLPIPPTRLIGRDAELSHLCGQLQYPDIRLVTLVGPPGVGKTRLAIQVAGELSGAFADGATFVDLSTVQDASLVGPALLQSLGAREQTSSPLSQQLADLLRDQHRLLVLDNFEHVLEAAPVVAELLSKCRRLAALVTSRTPLHLRGEWEYPVGPLALPEPEEQPLLSAVVAAPAVALFTERAQQKKPGFQVTAHNATTVIDLCALLDGLPLAIELAAAWVPQFALPALLSRLSSSLAILSTGAQDLPPRHRTLYRAIAWSYDALGRSAQQLFARLGVFAGGCGEAAAEAICQEPGAPAVDVRDGLFALAGKQLLRQEHGPDGAPRFGMLLTIREYARERLAEEPAAAAVYQRHADFYLALAEQREPELTGPQQVPALNELEVEHANLRAALLWQLEHGQPEPALRLAGALWRFWLMRGHLNEGRQHLELALERTPPAASAGRAKTLKGAGVLAHVRGDYAAARGFFAQSLQLYRELGDRNGLMSGLNNLAIVATSQQQFQEANSYCLEGLEIARELGNKTTMIHILNTLASNMEALGDYHSAERWYQQALQLAQEMGEIQATHIIQNNLGEVALALGQYQKALALHKQSLAHTRTHGFKHVMCYPLANLGVGYYQRGNLKQARRYLTDGLALAREVGNMALVVKTLARLGDLAYEEQALREMRELLEEAIVVARSIGHAHGLADALEGYAAALILQGQAPRGAQIFAAVERHYAATKPRTVPGQARYEKLKPALDQARQQLGPARFAELWDAGAQLTLEQAAALALEEELVPV